MAPADAPNTEACTGAADTALAGFGTKMEAMERAPAAGRVSNTIHYVHPASSSAYQDESRADAHARHGRQADSTTSWSRAPSNQISNLALYLCMAPKGNFLRFLRGTGKGRAGLGAVCLQAEHGVDQGAQRASASPWSVS